jgi:CTP:phosphocholine cytidylyltransferase-like protein
VLSAMLSDNMLSDNIMSMADKIMLSDNMLSDYILLSDNMLSDYILLSDNMLSYYFFVENFTHSRYLPEKNGSGSIQKFTFLVVLECKAIQKCISPCHKFNFVTKISRYFSNFVNFCDTKFR